MTAAVPLPDLFAPSDWLTLLDVSLTGIHLVRPVYGLDSTDIVDFAIEYLNPAGQRMTGLSEQPGGTLLGRFPHALAEGIFEYYRRAFETGEQLLYQTNYQADGLDNYFKFSARRSGPHLLVSFTDTSDQDRSTVEQALRLSQAAEQAARVEAEVQRQRFHDVLMQLPAHVAIHQGPDQVFTLVNPDYQRIANGRDLLGHPIREAWPELASHGILDVLDRVYQTGEPFIANEVPVQADFTRTGHLEQVYYNFVFLALRDAQGQINGVLNFSYDVTTSVRARQQVEQFNRELEARVQQRTEELAASNEELTATNEELQHSNQQLTRTNVDLDTFVYTASHDLKAPITNIESIVLALRDTLPPAVQQGELVAHLLSLLDKTVGRFLVTIAQLTDVSRLQLAHAGPAESVVLAAVVEDARLDLASAIVAADTQLTVEVAPELVLSFAPANLRSIVYNLLSNAVKYCAPGRPSQVWVRAQQTEASIVLTVQDNGLGLSALQQRQLFGLFQRLHTHVEGTGVGLYISKRLIENAGGTIAVQSQPDAGTTFTVTFPA